MRTIKLLLAVFVTVAASTLQSTAQDESTKMLYWWASQNQVFLWQSPKDQNPITATFHQGEGRWAVQPEKDAKSWRPILEKVAGSYEKNVNNKGLPDELLWDYTLTKLRNEYDAVRWAEGIKPSNAIYLKEKSPQAVELAFVYQAGGKIQRRTAEFTLSSEGKWKKSGKLDLNQIFGIPESSAELNRIFGTAAAVSPDFPEVWDEWVRKLADARDPLPPVAYTDQGGGMRWVWRERVGPDQALPETIRDTPPPPVDVAVPALVFPTPPPPLPSNGRSWQTILYISFIIVALVALAGLIIYLFRRPLRRLLALLSKVIPIIRRRWTNVPSQEEQQQTPSPVIPEQTLELLKTKLLERCRSNFPEGPLREVMMAMVNWIHTGYLAEAASSDLIIQTEDYKKIIIREYLRDELSLDEKDGTHLKEWAQIGRSAAEAVQRLNGLAVPEEVQRIVGEQVLAGLKSPQSLVSNVPQLLTAFKERLEARTSESRDLSQSLGELRNDFDRQIADKSAELTSTWERLVNELEADKRSLEASRDNLSSEIDTATNKIGSLQGTVDYLQNELNAIQQDRESDHGMIKLAKEKISRIEDVQRFSRELRKWLQGYFDVRLRDAAEIRPVALLASVINFSLYQMCFSIIDERQELFDVMANNIYKVTENFEQPGMGGVELLEVRKLLERLSPDVKTADSRLKDEDVGGETIDEGLFKGLLGKLNTDTGKNLSPFFIDVDKKKGTLVFIRVS